MDEILKRFTNLKPDIAENQTYNRDEVFSLYADVVSNDSKTSELSDLLYMKSRYFEEGFYCPLKPEELDKKIYEKIKERINGKL